ncbi:unnamed protein product, partial [Polarella glacialis]
VRLLFIREFSFPTDTLAAWDAIFADALVSNSEDASSSKSDAKALPSSAALPLADYLALAMIIGARPSKPEELMNFGDKPLDVRRLLAMAWELRNYASASPG